MTLGLTVVGVGVISLFLIISLGVGDGEILKGALQVARIVTMLAVISLFIMGIMYYTYDEPRVIYADCIIQYQSIDKCEVLSPQTENGK